MRFIEFEEIDSTNLEARRQADNGVTGPLWILAEKQTLGRGRRGGSGRLFLATSIAQVSIRISEMHAKRRR